MDKEKIIEFKLSHLDQYAILDKPCTIKVKCNSKLDYEKLYEKDGHSRWLVNLKAITRENLDLLKALSKGRGEYHYADIGHLLITGVIWEHQIDNPINLPAKGEEIIAVFDYVEDVLRCTGITVIPRLQPELFLYASDAMQEINGIENLIEDMNEEF